MDLLTRMCVFLMLFGIVHAKDWKPKIYARGEHATIHIGDLQINETAVLEITFSGYTSKRHVTNVMLYDPRKSQGDNISINTVYKDRIKRIEMNKTSFSFLLLNVDFVDSGNYTVLQNSPKERATSIFVIRHRLHGNDSAPLVLLFTCNITNITSIKIEMMISKLYFPVVKYDVTQKNCTEEGKVYVHRIESCVLNGNSFSFTIHKVNVFDMGMYVAWDDKDLLMDSVFVEFTEINTTSSPGSRDSYISTPFIPNLSSSRSEKYMLEIIAVSAVAVLLVAAGLIMNHERRLHRRKTSRTKTNDMSHMNAREHIASSSRNCIQTRETEHSAEATGTVLTENSDFSDLIHFAYNQIQDKVTLNENHLCARGLDSTMSVVSKIQIQPIVSSSSETIQSEPTHEYDDMNDMDAQETEFRYDQSCIRLYDTNQSEHFAEDSCSFDYVDQSCYKSLKTHNQYSIVTKKANEDVTITNSFSKYKNIKNTSQISIDPSTFYSNDSKERHSGIHCAGTRAELEGSDINKTLDSPSFLESEDSFSLHAIHLPNYSQHRRSRTHRISQSLTSFVYVPGPELSEHQEDIQSQSVSQTLYYDFAGHVLDDTSAKTRGHRRSQSCGSLYGNLMANVGV